MLCEPLDAETIDVSVWSCVVCWLCLTMRWSDVDHERLYSCVDSVSQHSVTSVE